VQKEYRTQIDVDNPAFDDLSFDFRIVCESTLASEQRKIDGLARTFDDFTVNFFDGCQYLDISVPT